METYEQKERAKAEQRNGEPVKATVRRLYAQPTDQEWIVRHLNSVIAVDIDGTLVEGGRWLGEGNFKALRKGARAALKRAKAQGYTITLYSVRKDAERIANWAQMNGIPFDFIEQKPYFTRLFDDRAESIEHWDRVSFKELALPETPSSIDTVVEDDYYEEQDVPEYVEWRDFGEPQE